jgi:hypothetical protein
MRFRIPKPKPDKLELKIKNVKLKCTNLEKMEYWNNGILKNNIPTFHYSRRKFLLTKYSAKKAQNLTCQVLRDNQLIPH